MDPDALIQFIAFIIFTGSVGFFSWRATRRDDKNTSAGYFLAGRSLPWIVVGGSLLLTNLSTEQLVGLNGGAFSNGMQVMAWEVSGKQVVLKDRNGNTIGSVYKTADARFGLPTPEELRRLARIEY